MSFFRYSGPLSHISKTKSFRGRIKSALGDDAFGQLSIKETEQRKLKKFEEKKTNADFDFSRLAK